LNIAESFNVLITSLSVLHNYFVDPNKIIFRSVLQQIVLSVHLSRAIYKEVM